MSALLVVAHPDPRELGRLTELVRAWGHAVIQAGTPARLSATLEQDGPAAVLCSAKFFPPEPPRTESGTEAATEPGTEPGPAWIVLGGPERDPEQLSVERVEETAADADLERALRRALTVGALRNERERLRGELAERGPAPLVGRGPDARRLNDQLARIAGTPRTTALILGERGSGRAALARMLHARSTRADGPFIAVECTPDSPEFSTRLARAAGRARGGTLLVHRVEHLDGDGQGVLAHLVLERVWGAVAHDFELPLEARLVATGPLDLAERVEEGRFRESLFSRLNVMSTRIAPLRERPTDLTLVAEHHLTSVARERGLSAAALDPAARAVLARHAWPGNELELRDVLGRALERAGGRPIQPAHLDLVLGGPTAGGEDRTAGLPLGDRSWRFVEEALIRHVLCEVKGNRSQAARVLGVNRTTLYNKLRTYRIED